MCLILPCKNNIIVFPVLLLENIFFIGKTIMEPDQLKMYKKIVKYIYKDFYKTLE